MCRYPSKLSLRLTTQLMIDTGLSYFYWVESKDRSRWKTPPLSKEEAISFHEIFQRLQKLTKQFEREVWFGGLQEATLACKVKGMEGEYNNIKFLSYCLAGRCMITISDGNSDITLITAEDELPFERRLHRLSETIGDELKESWGPMGIQSINSTEQTAANLITILITNWKDFNIKPDEDHSIGVA